MRFPIISAIYQKEMLDMVRDRRTLISMVAVPLLIIPLMLTIGTRVVSRIQERSRADAKSMGVAVRVSTPAIREAVARAGMQLVEKIDLQESVRNKEAAAAVEEIAGTPPEVRIYVDNSNLTSAAAGEAIRASLTELKVQQIRGALRDSGIAEAVLTPFTVNRTNVAGERKMAGMIWGTMLGSLVLLLMFTGGMYPVIDMTAGEKERKTMEALLASPASRREIVLGKTLAAMTAIFMTAALVLGSMVFSLKSAKFTGPAANAAVNAEEARRTLGTIPLDPHALMLIVVILLPMALLAASLMFAIALLARSFKEGQSYLTPLTLVVIFPAMLSSLPGFEMSRAFCLIPIFNVSLIIRGVLQGDVSMVNFAITMAANIVYAGIAFVVATRTFENESVLFRS
jgi:sodium transport system permease protein